MEQWIVVHKEWGIFLGDCIGMSFWSDLDDVGQEFAVAFGTEGEAWAFAVGRYCATDRARSAEFRVLRVESDPGYVSLDEARARRMSAAMSEGAGS